MHQITIDCSNIETQIQLHETFAQSLNFPSWYGKNLDALYDCLAAICEDTELTLLHFTSLPGFSRGFLRVLTDASKDNSHLAVTLL